MYIQFNIVIHGTNCDYGGSQRNTNKNVKSYEGANNLKNCCPRINIHYIYSSDLELETTCNSFGVWY